MSSKQWEPMEPLDAINDLERALSVKQFLPRRRLEEVVVAIMELFATDACAPPTDTDTDTDIGTGRDRGRGVYYFSSCRQAAPLSRPLLRSLRLFYCLSLSLSHLLFVRSIQCTAVIGAAFGCRQHARGALWRNTGTVEEQVLVGRFEAPFGRARMWPNHWQPVSLCQSWNKDQPKGNLSLPLHHSLFALSTDHITALTLA